jgi:hypothetical protein
VVARGSFSPFHCLSLFTLSRVCARFVRITLETVKIRPTFDVTEETFTLDFSRTVSSACREAGLGKDRARCSAADTVAVWT